MKALIVAGGRSTRMRMEEHKNKCLLKIGSKSILEHSINSLKREGVDDIYIITGHQKEKMEENVGKKATCIFHKDYRDTGINPAIWQARKFLHGEKFLLLMGDLLYHPNMIKECKNTDSDIAVTYERKKEYDTEDSKLLIKDGKIISMGKDLDLSLTSGEFGHMMKLSERGSILLFDEIEFFIKKNDLHKYLMDVINSLISKDIHVLPIDITGIPRIEIDFQSDLKKARGEIFQSII